MPGILWERFDHDPRRPENAALRASDKDRDLVQDVLGTAYAEGRLTREELDEREDRTIASKTLGELPPLVSDLVSMAASSAVPMVAGDRRAAAELKYRKRRQEALWAFLTPTIICWVVWFATMRWGFPWPLFVTLGTGIGFVKLATSRQETIASIEQDLEKKERRRIEKRAADERKQLGTPPATPEDS